MTTRPLPEPAPHRPVWPEIDDLSVQAIQAALLSGRLAVSGPPSRWPSRNVMAAAALARLTRRRHATLTASGSSAIVIALQAADVGPGDVVLLPATTWVACATAVLRVGAVPAFFDGTDGSPAWSVTARSTRPGRCSASTSTRSSATSRRSAVGFRTPS
ncbi:DegT/DnrJ/EryC1/StrS family aminotransferase [Nonomuraea thailandensis]